LKPEEIQQRRKLIADYESKLKKEQEDVGDFIYLFIFYF
jgi:hypothetical protein